MLIWTCILPFCHIKILLVSLKIIFLTKATLRTSDFTILCAIWGVLIQINTFNLEIIDQRVYIFMS